MDLVLRGRFALPDGRIERAEVAVTGGRIERVAKDIRAGGAPVTDFGDALVLPGGIDPHVHFRDPGHPAKEDFESGSTAAAFGGVTTVLDMPNTSPSTTTPSRLAEKRANAQRKSFVDFGLFAGLSDVSSLATIPHASALKIYLGASTGDLLSRDDALIARACRAASEASRTVAFHAEDAGCLDHFAPARPPDCEAAAVARVGGLKATGARLHVAHLSSAEGLTHLLEYLSAEATPHHLLLTEKDAKKLGPYGKMNPPLRGESDRQAVYAELVSGRIAMVASDHAPHTRVEKEGDAPPAGVPGVETMVPLLVAEAAAGRLPLARLASATAGAAGERFRLPHKGRIAEGYDADFAVYDLARVERIRPGGLHSRCGWSPFEGREAIFPTMVVSRGEVLVEGGAIVGRRGRGRFVAPA